MKVKDDWKLSFHHPHRRSLTFEWWNFLIYPTYQPFNQSLLHTPTMLRKRYTSQGQRWQKILRFSPFCHHPINLDRSNYGQKFEMSIVCSPSIKDLSNIFNTLKETTATPTMLETNDTSQFVKESKNIKFPHYHQLSLENSNCGQNFLVSTASCTLKLQFVPPSTNLGFPLFSLNQTLLEEPTHSLRMSSLPDPCNN